MAFDKATIESITTIAQAHDFEPAALLAVAEVESAGQAFALVNGRYEPLIRFEGHYFDARLTAEQKKVARAAGLSSPTAGKIANPSTQTARWALLNRAAEINAQAAFESTSWGLGQVMGSHWAALRFSSVTDMVNTCRSGAAGQAELMTRFINKAGLASALQARDWATFAKGYNGPAYAKNAYDTKMAKAYAKYAGGKTLAAGDGRVRQLQVLLTAAGFPTTIDGVSGPKTTAAVKSFQRSRGLVVDGIAGPATWAALEAAAAPAQVPASPAGNGLRGSGILSPKVPATPPSPTIASKAAPSLWARLLSIFFPKGT